MVCDVELEREKSGIIVWGKIKPWQKEALFQKKSQVYLKDGTQVPLSRGLYEEINRAVIQYF